MLIKCGRELAVRRRVAQFRERFDQLLFRAVKVSYFVKIKIVQGFEFHTRKSQSAAESRPRNFARKILEHRIVIRASITHSNASGHIDLDLSGLGNGVDAPAHGQRFVEESDIVQ